MSKHPNQLLANQAANEELDCQLYVATPTSGTLFSLVNTPAHQLTHEELDWHGALRTLQSLSPLARCIQRSACRLRHRQNGGLELGMFCKLPRTASSAHLSLLPASSFRHLLSLLLNRVTKRPVTDLTGKTQAVLSPAVDGEAVPGGEQALTQGRPPRRSAPDLSAVREGELSDRLHQQDDRGTGVPSVQGPR